MGTFALMALVREASTLLGSEACAAGRHDWATEGGRSCPKGHEHCSQAVYVCRTCSDTDYGEPGGPAHRDCFTHCHLGPAEADEEPL